MAKHKARRGMRPLKSEPASGDLVAALKDTMREFEAAMHQQKVANGNAVTRMITAQAQTEGRDLLKWQFNLDTMRWESRTTPPVEKE